MTDVTINAEPITTEPASSSCCGSCGTSAAPASEGTAANRSVFEVTGMTCGHCVSSVTAELKKIAGVTEVVVDLATGKVTVDSAAPLTDTEVAEAVDEAGYELKGRLTA